MNREQRLIPVAIGRIAAGPPEDLPTARVERSASPEGVPPLIDIHEGPEGLVLEADLPGVGEQSVAIQLDDNVISLQASVEPAAPEGARLVHQEYRVADFRRSFILSDDVDRDRITAELKNGVLRLWLPRTDRARTRRIEVKSS